jgi:hypothetical protein
MRPEDVLRWLRAQPFRPFRITLNSGRTFDVRHPEMVRLLRTTLLLFTLTEQADVYEWAEMVGLLLIESIAPLEAPPASAAPAPGDAANGPGAASA